MSADQNPANDAPRLNLPVEFRFQDQPVRTIREEDEAWFIANDACAALDLKNPNQVLTRLDDDEKGVRKVDTLGGPQQLAVVTLSGLVRLITRSNKPEARAFQRWLFHDVVPSIYKTGRYDAGRREEQPRVSVDGDELRIAHTGPGRYFLTIQPDQPPHIYEVPFESVVDDDHHLNVEILGLGLKNIEAFWQKYQQLLSVGNDPNEGFVQRKLEEAILHGAGLATHFLKVYGLRRSYQL
ncbi:Bro-N domain-containing protein [Methylocystis sp. IM4]|uniref:BRO-N domain-containing protein n=1 Tax=Methylocystis sp. IM4 TaxID=3136560 RepID=UPI003119978D